MNFFSENLDSFRKKTGLLVNEFCEVSRIPEQQYVRYRSGYNQFLQINDALKLMAGFPDDISISSLCSMCGIPLPKISKRFPSFYFMNSEPDQKSNQRIQRFVYGSLLNRFSSSEFAELYSSLTSDIDIFSDDIIKSGYIPYYLNKFSLYSFMYTLRTIRGLSAKDYDLPAATVNKHLLRRARISRFSDLCMYESKFSSDGVFLFLEMLYSGEQSGIRVSLRSSK